MAERPIAYVSPGVPAELIAEDALLELFSDVRRIADALEVLAGGKKLEVRARYEAESYQLRRWQSTKPGRDEEGDEITQEQIGWRLKQYSDAVANLEWAYPWLKEG